VTEYTAKRARTRAQLLAAGQDLLPGSIRRGLEHALGPGPVTQRAEVSRQTWYRYWRADNTGYLDELLSVALDTVSFLLDRRLSDIVARTGRSRDALGALARAHFALLTQRRIAIPALTGVMLALEDRVLEQEQNLRPTAAPAIAREYTRRVTEAVGRAYGEVLSRDGRVPADHSDLGGFVDLLIALGDGYALRQLAAPEPGADEGFAQIVVDLCEQLTVPAPAHAATGS